MATAEVSSCTTDDDITTCTICLEQFNIPKYLPCLHTFCESCIAVYITSAFEKDNTRTCINCPVCRSNVSAPELGITPEQWAKRLPLNFLLVGLIEKHKVERPEKICMSCERFDVNKKSEANSVCIDCSDTLCSTCVNYHRINKSSSNQEIVDISRKGIVLKSFKNMCTEHKSKDLELFCVDHDLPCCATCVSVNHRKCENVLTIEDAASKFRETDSEDKTKNDVSALLSDIDIVMQLERESLENLETRNISQLETYNDFWTNVQKKVDAMKQNQTKRYQMHFEEEKSKLETSITDLENKKKTVANTKQILEITVREASNVQVMIEVQKVKKQIDQHLLTLPAKLTFYEINFQFKKNVDEVDKMLENICDLNCSKKSKSLELSSLKAENPSSNSSSSDSDSLLEFSSSKKKKIKEKPKKKRKAKGMDIHDATGKYTRLTSLNTQKTTGNDKPQTTGPYEQQATEAYIWQATEACIQHSTRTDNRQAAGTNKQHTTGIHTRQAPESLSTPLLEECFWQTHRKENRQAQGTNRRQATEPGVWQKTRTDYR
ncbi:tripartite motif-containing protein 45-like [Mytilus californianus]|uniref:tripartite motif-containing protein 45-like n=1 Tax=Mytilus californianus TaxID=6549 RepID=UPI002246875E|nr:tripartite motif-containing protein 45-like [Mytilus californianus]